MFTFLTWAMILIIAGAAIIVTVDYLTSDVIRKKVKGEIPEAQFAQIEEIEDSVGTTIGPKIRITARKNGVQTPMKAFEFRCNRSDCFYKGQKIRLYS